jgi:hypothetical protein
MVCEEKIVMFFILRVVVPNGQARRQSSPRIKKNEKKNEVDRKKITETLVNRRKIFSFFLFFSVSHQKKTHFLVLLALPLGKGHGLLSAIVQFVTWTHDTGERFFF